MSFNKLVNKWVDEIHFDLKLNDFISHPYYPFENNFEKPFEIPCNAK